jgi:hypothetical protein
LLLSSPAPDSSKVQSLKAAFRPSQLLFWINIVHFVFL